MRTPFGRQASGARLERMAGSPRFHDGGFHNLHPILPGLKGGEPMPSIGEFLCASGRRLPPAPLPSVDPRPAWARPPETGLRVTWLGHSTLLVELDGVRLLTDPVWGERASPLGFAGPKRFQPVPVSIADLPAIDAVIVSHDHYDHLDYPTVVELGKRGIPFVTSLGVGAHLEAWGVKPSLITELDWWESLALPRAGVTLSAAPSQHFSGRGPGMKNSTLWSSFVARGPKHAFFFSGDTGLTQEYTQIRERFGPFDLVALEVGAFHPAWGDIHLGPAHALEAFELLGGARFLPVHWGTFNLAIHDWDEPAETLLQLAPQTSAPLAMPILGEAIEPSRVERVEPWWRKVTVARGAKAQPQAPELEPARAAEGGSAGIEWPLD